jgi:type I restriction enzyme S subunit
MNINCAVFDSTITNGNTTMDTKALRQKILDLAIRGKLVPQDPNDEPASVLLERIKAEKERLIKEGKIKRSKKAAKTSDTPHYGNVPFEVPKGWVWTTLGEISNYGDCSNVSVIEIAADEWILELEDLEKDTASIIQMLSKKERNIKGVRHKFKKGDVLYSKLRTYLNKVLVAPKFGYCTTEIIPFNSYCGISNFYLCHVLRSAYFLDYTQQCGYGVKMPRLSTNDACKGMIPLPPLAEQHRIVTEIEKWFALIDIIENGKADLQTTIKQTKSKILDLAIHGKLVPQDPNDEPAIELLKRINPDFTPCDNGHSEKLPSGWRLANLGMIGAWQSGGTPSRSNKSYYGGSIPWLKTGDLNDGLILDVPERITEEAVANSSAKINPTGSVLIAMYGATIGKLGILTFPATTNQACCACIEFCGITQLFLFYFLLSQRKTFVSKGGGGAQSNISKEIIVNHNISLPPLAEQQRIVQKIEDLFSILDNIQK